MKSLLLPLTAMLCLTSTPALAQSTPFPKDALESAAKPAPVLPAGTFSEIENDHAIGQPDAPVTLIMYASVTCPHCASWFETDWASLKANYIETGKVRFVFREFPTSPAQLAAANFAIAACAPEADYMKNIEYQMATQEAMFARLQDESVPQGESITALFNERGAVAGLTEDDIETCLKNEAHYAKINQSVDQAQAAQVNSVPAVMLNGTILPAKDSAGAPLSTAIEAALAAN